MPQAGIEPAIPASERPQMYPVDLEGLAVVTNTQVITTTRISMTCHIFILASFYMSN